MRVRKTVPSRIKWSFDNPRVYCKLVEFISRRQPGTMEMVEVCARTMRKLHLPTELILMMIWLSNQNRSKLKVFDLLSYAVLERFRSSRQRLISGFILVDGARPLEKDFPSKCFQGRILGSLFSLNSWVKKKEPTIKTLTTSDSKKVQGCCSALGVYEGKLDGRGLSIFVTLQLSDCSCFFFLFVFECFPLKNQSNVTLFPTYNVRI